jgi:chemotaxis signal transduction protein
MATQTYERLHTLIVPTQSHSLLIPSAMTAEVINVPTISRIPFSQPWVLGAVGWRRRALSVVSWEILLGAREEPPIFNRSKLVVFHPLQGRNKWEFFALLASSEPQPHMVDNTGALTASTASSMESPFIGTITTIGKQEIVIPNIAEMARTFYPSF